jgi:hypothetical protein
MLRVLAVLAALTVVGGVLRFHAASDPSAYQSKDEQSYAMIARGLSVTGNYGNPGMTDPVHWPPGAPLMFALAYELKPQKRGGGVWDVPSAYPAQALVRPRSSSRTSSRAAAPGCSPRLQWRSTRRSSPRRATCCPSRSGRCS